MIVYAFQFDTINPPYRQNDIQSLQCFLIASSMKSHPLPRCSAFAVFSEFGRFQNPNRIIDNIISQEGIQRSSYIYIEFLRKMLPIPPFQHHYWSGRMPRKKLDSESEMQSILLFQNKEQDRIAIDPPGNLGYFIALYLHEHLMENSLREPHLDYKDKVFLPR